MLSRLKLLKRLREVDLRPDEAWALMDRGKTQTSSAEDHARFARLMRVTTSGMDQLRTEPLVPEAICPSAAVPRPTSQAQASAGQGCPAASSALMGIALRTWC